MGALIAASMLPARALAPAGQIVGLLMQYQGARTALESLNKMMDQPVERPGRRDLHPAAASCAATSSSATSSSPTRTGRTRRSTA